MQCIIYAKTERGLDGFLKVVTTLRRKTFDIQDVGMSSEESGSKLRIVLNEQPEKGGVQAVGYLNQIYDVYDVTMATL